MIWVLVVFIGVIAILAAFNAGIICAYGALYMGTRTHGDVEQLEEWVPEGSRLYPTAKRLATWVEDRGDLP